MESLFNIDRDELQARVHDNIVIINMKCSAFQTLTDLEKNQDVIPWFDEVEKNKDIKGILIFNSGNCLGSDVYHSFLESVADVGPDKNNPNKISKFKRGEIRAIEINMLVNYIRKLTRFSKIVIGGLQGEVVTPFFGLTLAFDFRFATPDLRFLLSHARYGLHPSGALPYFLPKFVGQGNAVRFLLRGGEIDATSALELGLINQIYQTEEFEHRCIEEASKICEMDTQVIQSTKGLVYALHREIDTFFEKEVNYVYR